ncbi:MAG TPA: DcaP family trimeric outer membrane transporter [Candidatus Angelobacter sp.]
MQKTWTLLPVFLVLLCGALRTRAQETGNAQEDRIRKLETKMDELKSQMGQIQAELDAIRGTKVPATGSIVSTPPPLPQKLSAEQQLAAAGQATQDHQTFARDEEDAPRLYNAPLERDYPGFFRLPNTRTILRIDGSARTDFIYDPRTSALGDSFIPSAIPIPSVSGPANFIASIRGSRFSTDFRIPVTDQKVGRTFVQLDFFGANGATAPRLRHFYAQLDNVLVGQTFTNFMDPDAFADTLDTQGANSAISVRIPQGRYSFPLGEGASASVSVEVPASSINFSINGDPAVPFTPAPDGTIRLRKEWQRGHIQLASVFRNLGAQLPNGVRETAFGWGLNGTSEMQVYGKDSIVIQLAYGNGISRYVGDTAPLGLDAAPKSQTNLSLVALPLFATYGSYQHYWTPGVRSSATFSFLQLQNTQFQPATTYHKSSYSSANLIWNVAGSLNLGAEFIYGWVEEKSGAHANAPRFQITGRYTFVKLHPAE